MPPETVNVPLERRLALLQAAPSFATIPVEILQKLAAVLTVESFPPGTAILKEGEAGDRAYVLENGTVEVSVQGPSGEVKLGRLEAGAVFGEIALLTDNKRRKATVTAVGPIVTLNIHRLNFERLTAAYPEVRMDLALAADSLLATRQQSLRTGRPPTS